MNTPRRMLFLTLGVLSGAGCVHHIDFSKLPPPDGPALLAEVDGRQSALARVKGSARVAVKGRDGSGEVTAFIAARSPAEVHLELLDFFGSPAQVLVSDGRTFGLYRRDNGTWLHGPASAATVSRLLPVALSTEDLVAILLGRTPRLPVAPTSVEPDPEADAYRMTLVQGDHRQTLWIDPIRPRVVRSVLEGPGGYSVRFEGLGTTHGVPFASKVTFTESATTVVLRWSDEDLELDGPLGPALFQVTAPPGAREVAVDAPDPVVR